jgi:hypothetical protein
MTAVSSLRGYRQFYYGGSEGVADKPKQALVNTHPNLEVAGTLARRRRPTSLVSTTHLKALDKCYAGRRSVGLRFEKKLADHGESTGAIVGAAVRAEMCCHNC